MTPADTEETDVNGGKTDKPLRRQEREGIQLIAASWLPAGAELYLQRYEATVAELEQDVRRLDWLLQHAIAYYYEPLSDGGHVRHWLRDRPSIDAASAFTPDKAPLDTPP